MENSATRIRFRDYLVLCLKETFRTVWEKSDIGATVAGIILPIVVHFVPAWEHAVNNILWEIPIACLVSLVATRLLLSPFLIYRSRDLDAQRMASKVHSLTGPTSFSSNHSATPQTSGSGLPMIVHRVSITNDSSMVAQRCQLVIQTCSIEVPELSMDTPLNIKDANVLIGDIGRGATSHFDLFMTFHKANKGDSPYGTYILAPNRPSIPPVDGEQLEEITLKLQGDNFDPKRWRVTIRVDRSLIEIMAVTAI